MTATNASKFFSRLRLGVNLDGKCINGSAGQAAMQSLKAHTTGGFIRSFFRIAPTNNIGGYGTDSDGLISTSEINQCLDGVAYGISIGLPIDLGLIGDTQVDSDFSSANLPRAKAQVAKICALIKARNFDLTMLCLHNVNEYGGYDSNTVVNPLNVALDAIIRGYLPTIPLLRKGSEWGNYGYSMASDLAPPLDPEYLLGCHSYETMSAAYATTVAAGMQAAVVRGGYAGWIWEECGFGPANLSKADPASVWIANWQNIIPAVATHGGAAAGWCVTYGSDWKMNNGDLTLTTACANIMSWMSSGGAAWGTVATPPIGTLPPIVTPPVKPPVTTPPVTTPPVTNPPVTTPPVSTPVATPTTGTLTASVVVTATGTVFTIDKETGGKNTIRLAMANKWLVLYDGAPDGPHTFTQFLPAPGSYVANVYLDGSTLQVPLPFTVPATGTTPPVTVAPGSSPPSAAQVLAAYSAASAAVQAKVIADLGFSS